MTSPAPGAVFDCVVFVQALANRKGPAFACKQLVDTGRVALFLSPQIIAELTEVLSRPKLQKKFATLTADNVEAFLTDLASKAVSLSTVPTVFSYPRDTKDEPCVNLALACGAGYLVTWDKDLLDLMKQTSAEGKLFRQRFPNLAILNPVAFLQEMQQREQSCEDPPAPDAFHR